MLKRTITAIVGVAVLLPILWLSDTYVFPIAVSIVAVIALYEMYECIGCKSKYAMTIPAYLACAAFPILSRFSGMENVLPIVGAFFILYLLYLLLIAVLAHAEYTMQDISICYVMTVYITGGFLSIELLREMSDRIYFLVFIGAWITDIFAYFVGRLFGKHKLCETISPKKTVEGSIGGVVFCVIFFVLFSLAMPQKYNPWLYLIMACVGILVSAVSQIGDLSMSLIKRHYGIKDFGKIFPGHGGVMDRFDSILAVSLMLFLSFATLKAFNFLVL
ncbi:MAG: phosphatidate cytidylyltransferase [Clostridia bacterium]|nr:phosphatidate cytidylyltransferase [Clostridia bacterium]